MHISALSTLFLAASALAFPTEKRTAPSTELTIRAWNQTTSFDCDWKNPHAKGEMGPDEDTWGNPTVGSSYNSYSIDRDLAANETLNMYSTSGTEYCGTFLYSSSSLTQGCYQSGTNESFSCIKMTTS